MDSKYLTIPPGDFIAAYNDYEYAYHIHVKPGQGELEYLSWSSATVLLNKFYPNLTVEFEKNENGLPTFKLENNILKEAKEVFEQYIVEKQELLKGEKDWKAQKNLKKEIAEYSDQLYYDNRGVVVLPYIVDKTTGLRTPSMLFPVMNNTNDPIYNPDSRDINDACMRSAVKAAAVGTGIALRLYTREDVGKGSTTDSDKFKKIDEIVKCSAILGKLVDKTVVNFGSSMPMLNKVANDLKKEIEIKKEERAKKSQ